MSMTNDRSKVEKAVEALLQEVIASGKTICFFDMNAMMASLKLSHLPKSKYHETIADVLTWNETHDTYGDWITCEYEMNIRALVQLAKPGEPQSVCNEEKNHFVMYGATSIRKSFPLVKKQKLSVEIPAGVDPVEAVQRMQALFNEATTN